MIKFEKDRNSFLNKDFNSVYWLTGLQGDKNDRCHYHLTLHVDCGVAVKTDGSRLFAACIEADLPDGDYEIVSRKRNQVIIEKKESEHKWPEWERYIDPDIRKDPDFYLEVDKNWIGPTVGKFYLGLHENCNNGDMPLLNADYVETALEGFEHCQIYATGDTEPVFIVDYDYNHVAVIMPMRKE